MDGLCVVLSDGPGRLKPLSVCCISGFNIHVKRIPLDVRLQRYWSYVLLQISVHKHHRTAL